MKIQADDREDGEVIEKLRALKVDVEVERLKEADYVYEDIGVERKTINDFCLSIIDGRMKSQAEKMLKKYFHNYVLISGRISDRTTEIDENCILGMISSLLVKGVSVVCVDDDEQLVFLMKRIFERHSESKDCDKNEMSKM